MKLKQKPMKFLVAESFPLAMSGNILTAALMASLWEVSSGSAWNNLPRSSSFDSGDMNDPKVKAGKEGAFEKSVLLFQSHLWKWRNQVVRLFICIS